MAVLSLPELAAPLLGAIVDRTSKKQILSVTTGMEGVVTFCLIGALIMTSHSTTPLYIAAIMLGALEVLDWPAFQAMFAVTVPAQQLAKANSLWNGLEATLVIVGPVVGGYLVGRSMALALLIVSTSYILAWALLFLIRVNEPPLPVLPVSRSEMLTGLNYVWKNTRIRYLLAISTVWNVVESAGMPFILVVLRRHLHLNAAVTGVTYGMEGVGTLLGTVMFAMVSPWVPRNVGVVMGAIIGSALFGLWFFVGTGGEAVALILAMGMISAFYSLNIRTWRQEIVPHEIFGRVIAIFRMTARSTTPFIPLLGSLAIAQLGLPLFYLGIGVGGLITSTWLGWRMLFSTSREFRSSVDPSGR